MTRLLAGALCLIMSVGPSFAAPRPDPRNAQYMMGYDAGRRDERIDLCRRFEKHSAVAETLLGKARMMLIRAFCQRKP